MHPNQMINRQLVVPGGLYAV